MGKNTSKVVSLVWDNLLDESVGSDGSYRVLSCGCIVFSDGEYLDLFVATNADGMCTAHDTHELIHTLNMFSGVTEINGKPNIDKIRRLINDDLQGWPARRAADILAQYDAI